MFLLDEVPPTNTVLSKLCYVARLDVLVMMVHSCVLELRRTIASFVSSESR